VSIVRIGILTGGGDCPGLNAVIRAVVRKGISSYQHTIFGFRNGYQGLVDQQAVPLTLDSVRGILHQGGTILGTSRVDPLGAPDGAERVKEAMEIHLLDGLIVIGGEGTLRTAWKLHSELEIPVVAVPKTIDNDLASTDRTFGFDTAVTIATEAVDRLHSTAEAHQRVMVLEVMGRHAGWIATHAGIAGGADVILIPEKPFDIVQVARHLKRRAGIGRTFSIVVVAEGAQPVEGTMQIPEHDRDEYGRPRLGGISQYIAQEIEQRTGIETRVTILGHVQRGGTPTAFDRVLATQLGIAAIDLASQGQWGMMAALQGAEVASAPISEATGRLNTVPESLYQVAEVFFA
jgi:ATP-dependent phosphofructokinase / diphosphate-dependent phosphofructokinase